MPFRPPLLTILIPSADSMTGYGRSHMTLRRGHTDTDTGTRTRTHTQRRGLRGLLCFFTHRISLSTEKKRMNERGCVHACMYTDRGF